MKQIAFAVLAATLAVSTLTPGTAAADPKNIRKFCATHRVFAGPIEEDEASLPPEVKRAGANAWRCMDGKVMVCQMGASGAACAKTGPMTARRMKAFREFCRNDPDNNFIPMSLIFGLASTWRCDGTRPVQMTTTPTDRLGYFKASWRALR